MTKKQNPVVESNETPFIDMEAPVKPTMKVGQRARQLILEGELDNKGILAVLQQEYPTGKTSMACVAWYKSDVKKAKTKEVDPDQGYKDWLKANDLELRTAYEATLVVEQA
jgi:hypothetical protein